MALLNDMAFIRVTYSLFCGEKPIVLWVMSIVLFCCESMLFVFHLRRFVGSSKLMDVPGDVEKKWLGAKVSETSRLS